MQREEGKESLRQAVERLDENLWHQFEDLWRRAKDGIHDAQHSQDGYQQSTPHSRAVEENLSALIPDDWKGTQFTATDLFVLSVAAAPVPIGVAKVNVRPLAALFKLADALHTDWPTTGARWPSWKPPTPRTVTVSASR